MAYKDKDRQREVNRERQRRYKARQKALPEQGVTQGVTGFEKVAALYNIPNYELLESWAEGQGTEPQRRYGVLARHYRTAYSTA